MFRLNQHRINYYSFWTSVLHSVRQYTVLGRTSFREWQLYLISLVFWGVFSSLCFEVLHFCYIHRLVKTEDFSKLSRLLSSSYFGPCGLYILRPNDYYFSKDGIRLVSLAAVQLWVHVLGKAFNFLSISNRKYKRVSVVGPLQNWTAHLQGYKKWCSLFRFKESGSPKTREQVGYSLKAAARDSFSLEKSLKSQEIVVSWKTLLTSK